MLLETQLTGLRGWAKKCGHKKGPEDFSSAVQNVRNACPPTLGHAHTGIGKHEFSSLTELDKLTVGQPSLANTLNSDRGAGRPARRRGTRLYSVGGDVELAAINRVRQSIIY